MQTSNQISRFRPNITFRHTFRWVDIRASNSGQLTSSITPAALCAASAYLGTSAVNIFPALAAVRVQCIRMAAIFPEGGSFTAGNSYIGVELSKTVNGQNVAGAGTYEVSVPVVSPADLTRLVFKPPKSWLAGNWVSVNDANNFFYLRTLPGTMIEIDMECTINDGQAASSYACAPGGLDTQGFSFLDLVPGVGSRYLKPLGAQVIFG